MLLRSCAWSGDIQAALRTLRLTSWAARATVGGSPTKATVDTPSQLASVTTSPTAAPPTTTISATPSVSSSSTETVPSSSSSATPSAKGRTSLFARKASNKTKTTEATPLSLTSSSSSSSPIPLPAVGREIMMVRYEDAIRHVPNLSKMIAEHRRQHGASEFGTAFLTTSHKDPIIVITPKEVMGTTRYWRQHKMGLVGDMMSRLFHEPLITSPPPQSWTWRDIPQVLNHLMTIARGRDAVAAHIAKQNQDVMNFTKQLRTIGNNLDKFIEARRQGVPLSALASALTASSTPSSISETSKGVSDENDEALVAAALKAIAAKPYPWSPLSPSAAAAVMAAARISTPSMPEEETSITPISATKPTTTMVDGDVYRTTLQYHITDDHTTTDEDELQRIDENDDDNGDTSEDDLMQLPLKYEDHHINNQVDLLDYALLTASEGNLLY
jgi:hypothetical protein